MAVGDFLGRLAGQEMILAALEDAAVQEDRVRQVSCRHSSGRGQRMQRSEREALDEAGGIAIQRLEKGMKILLGSLGINSIRREVISSICSIQVPIGQALDPNGESTDLPITKQSARWKRRYGLT